MGSFWKIKALSFDLPAGEDYSDDNIDISPPETENWTPTERRRKRNPLMFLPEDDNSIKFFEKGLHQTVDRPETERPLTPYGGLKFSWQKQEEFYHHKETDEDGTTRYYNEKRELHRLDGPAVEHINGNKYWVINSKIIGDSVGGFTEEDFENYKRKHTIKVSQKLSWGHERNIWVTHWAVPGNQKMNPTDIQQDWTVVTFLPPAIGEGFEKSFEVIKERFKEYVRQNFPETTVEGNSYMWANAYLWNVQSEKSDFLDKYLTEDEINSMKEDTIVVIDKKDFPVEVSSPIESF